MRAFAGLGSKEKTIVQMTDCELRIANGGTPVSEYKEMRSSPFQ